MKRKIFSVLLVLVLVLGLGLVTGVPVGAVEPPQPTEPDAVVFPFELGGKTTEIDDYIAEWDEETVYDGSSSVHLATAGDVVTGNEARILIDLSGMPEGEELTLGDIESISWWVYAVTGYPPHLDITLDTTDANQSMLTAEMNLNCVGAPKPIATLQGEIAYNTGWLQTFELTSVDGFGDINDDTIFWVTKMGSGDQNAPWGPLADWKGSTVANDPEGELAETEISSNTVVLYLEIEVDNWVVQSEAYVDDITIKGVGEDPILLCGQIQDAVDSVGDNSFIYVMPGTYEEDVTVDKDLTLVGAQFGVDPKGGRAGDESEIVGVVEVTSAATDVAFAGFKFTSPTRDYTPRGFNLRIESESSTISNNIFVAEENEGHTYSGYLDFEGITNATVIQNSFSGHLDIPQEPNVVRLGITGAGIVTVADNEMHDVGGGGGIGIMCGNAAVVNIDGNEIENTGNECIWVWNPSGSAFATLSITSNELSEATLNGIKFVAPITGVVSVSGNDFSNNPVQVLDEAECLDIQGVLDTNDFDRAVTVDHASLLHTIWSSIQDGITEAVSGDTVNVAAGTYSGDEPLSTNAIEVNKSLTLLGANAGECAGVLPSTRGDESVIDDTTLAILASGVTIDGFLFDGGAMHTGTAGCIYAKNLSHLTISNNVFLLGEGKVEEIEIPYEGKSTPRRAMVLGDYNGTAANEMAVTCNDIHGLPGGSVYINPWTGVGTNVLFQYNSFHDNAGGICSDAAGLSILNNDFTGNGTGVSCTGNDVVVRDNNFDSNGTNIKIGSEWGFPVVTGVSILNNNIQNSVSDTGILLKDNAAAGNEAHFNNIVGNDIGVKNEDPDDTFAATLNWWGNSNGPSAAAFDAYPIGDAVSGDVGYIPWLPGEWELFFDTEGNLIHSDNDGFSDLEEYWLGTDPKETGSCPGAPIGEVDTVYVEGSDPEVELQDSKGPIADVDISGAPSDASGTITGTRYTTDPGETSLSVGTGTTGVVFLDVKVTGYTSGTARITVPYLDEEQPPEVGWPIGDGIVDGTTIEETTLSLYYWDDATSTWLTADNNVVEADANTVSGDIPVSALTGTPIGTGGYLEDEAAVAIESIVNLSNRSNPEILKPDTVELTIDTNTAFLGAATIDLTFDPSVVEVLGVVGKGAFDTLTVNTNHSHSGSDMQVARFLAYQGVDEAGVDATGGVVVAVVKLKAIDSSSTMDFSPLHLHVVTLKDNKGDWIPRTSWDPSFALVGGVGDANGDTYVSALDLVEIARAILAFPGHSIDTPTMNVDGKDGVDAYDCTYLARYFIGLPDYPLPPLGWMSPWGPWPPPPAPPPAP